MFDSHRTFTQSHEIHMQIKAHNIQFTSFMSRFFKFKFYVQILNSKLNFYSSSKLNESKVLTDFNFHTPNVIGINPASW